MHRYRGLGSIFLTCECAPVPGLALAPQFSLNDFPLWTPHLDLSDQVVQRGLALLAQALLAFRLVHRGLKQEKMKSKVFLGK